MRTPRAIKEYILLECLSQTTRQIYDELVFAQGQRLVEKPRSKQRKPVNIKPRIDRVLNSVWTVGVLANPNFLPKHKDLVVRCQAIVRLCFDSMTTEGDVVLYSEPESAIDFETQQLAFQLAFEWCGAEFNRIAAICEIELVLMGKRPEDAERFLGMSIGDFIDQSATEIEERIEEWKPIAKRRTSTVAKRNAKWLRQSLDGKSTKEIAREWRQQTGEEVTPEAVRQGIYRARYKT